MSRVSLKNPPNGISKKYWISIEWKYRSQIRDWINVLFNRKYRSQINSDNALKNEVERLQEEDSARLIFEESGWATD